LVVAKFRSTTVDVDEDLGVLGPTLSSGVQRSGNTSGQRLKESLIVVGFETLTASVRDHPDHFQLFALR